MLNSAELRNHGRVGSMAGAFQRPFRGSLAQRCWLKQEEFGKSVPFLKNSWELMNLGYAHFTSKNLLLVLPDHAQLERNGNNPGWKDEMTAQKMKACSPRESTRRGRRAYRIGPAVPGRLDSRDSRAGQRQSPHRHGSPDKTAVLTQPDSHVCRRRGERVKGGTNFWGPGWSLLILDTVLHEGLLSSWEDTLARMPSSSHNPTASINSYP